MKKLLILSLMLTSCASYTVKSISVYDKQVSTSFTQQEMTEVIEFVLDTLGKEKLFEGWNITFVNTEASTYKDLDGKVYDISAYSNPKSKMIFSKVNQCQWDTSILHEMAHVILYDKYGSGDRDHTYSYAWDIVNMIEEDMIRRCSR